MTYFTRSLLLAAALTAVTAAQGDCLHEKTLACIKFEQSKPDTSRGGVSAAAMCAAFAMIACDREGSSGDVAPQAQGPAARSAEQTPSERFQPSSPSASPKPAKADKYLSVFEVRGGSLKVSTSSMYGDTPDVKASIRYNDTLIEEFPDELLSIDGFLNVGDQSVLLYATNMGGSGTLNSHALVAINGQGKIYRATLPAGYERFEYRVSDERIEFELGVSEGKTVRAVFASGRLDVTKTPIPKGPLSDQDCTMLYIGLLEECAEPRQTTCAYDDMALSMANQRPVNLLAADNPNYRPADFKASCEQACKAKRKPAFASFRKAVCQPR